MKDMYGKKGGKSKKVGKKGGKAGKKGNFALSPNKKIRGKKCK